MHGLLHVQASGPHNFAGPLVAAARSVKNIDLGGRQASNLIRRPRAGEIGIQESRAEEITAFAGWVVFFWVPQFPRQVW
jgi:hypothetical protein